LPPDSYPIELKAPDISPYRAGNTGVEFVTTFDSGQPGPHVMICAVTHGNELCGAITLDFLFRQNVRPVRGKLTLGFNNVAAFNRFDPGNATASRFVDEDFNRIWSEDVLNGPRDSAELRRARQIRPIIDTVDYLFDIHSMQHKTVPLLLSGPLDKGRKLARAMGYPADIVSDHGHAAGKRLRDYRFFGDPADRRNAILVECGQHWERASADVAIETTLRFLKQFDVVDPGFIKRHLKSADVPQKLIEITDAVTVTTENFQFFQDYKGMEVIERKGTVLGRDGERDVLTPYDNCVLIMPSRRLTKGQTAVRLGRLVV